MNTEQIYEFKDFNKTINADLMSIEELYEHLSSTFDDLEVKDNKIYDKLIQ